MEPLEPLFQDPSLKGLPLPDGLAVNHPGGLEIEEGRLYANFVSSLDGVVALAAPGLSSGGAISGRSPADRFLMGLLRAFASCILVGAGTFRADGGVPWTPASIHPGSAAGFAAVRNRLGLGRNPQLVVVTAGGEIDPNARGLEAGGLIYTTPRGASRLRGLLPGGVKVRELPGSRLRVEAVVEDLRSLGHSRILTEGGPHLVGQLVEARLLDELFLTLSPVLAGPGEGRLGLMSGLALTPEQFRWSRLLSARRSGSHLFLRYGFSRSGPE